MLISTTSVRAALVALCVVALTAAALGLRSSASAQAPAGRTLTFKELEKGATFTHIRNTKGASRRSNHQGDLLVIVNPLANASGHVVGRVNAACTTTTGARNFLRSTATCTGVVVLPGGTLTLQALISPGIATTTGAITGGTGAYTNARGVLVSEEGRGGSKDTITLAG
jgi:hypothetical protein